MKLLNLLIITTLMTLSFHSIAKENSSVVLTCDFTTNGNKIIVDYPQHCAKQITTKLIKTTSDRYLHSTVLFLAQPPLCPEGFNDLNINQGGRTSSGHAHQTNSYQVRRICVSK